MGAGGPAGCGGRSVIGAAGRGCGATAPGGCSVIGAGCGGGSVTGRGSVGGGGKLGTAPCTAHPVMSPCFRLILAHTSSYMRSLSI